jgi:polygalacturonase
MSLAEKKPRKSRTKARPVMRRIAAKALSPANRDLPPPFRMPAIRPPAFPDRTVDIRDHGAVGDDRTDCTDAIDRAIAACAKAGGGRVLVPPGKWFSGPIQLRSNVELHLSDGAIVRFCTEPARYLPAVLVRWCGMDCFNYRPLIYACDCQNIAITGKGLLLGQGKPWWGWEKLQQRSRARQYEMVTRGVPVEQRIFACEEFPMRPQFIQPINCTNVLLEDFTVAEAGPFWTIHLAYCRNVIVRRLHINACDGPNTDGIDIDSSRNVIIEDCELATGDDCISLKSGMNEEGWRVNRPTENVIIRRIRATAGIGGFSIGSDMSGGVRNVFVHDCDFENLVSGIRMKAARGRGGVVEDIHIRDIRMHNARGEAIEITTEIGSSFVKVDGKSPIFRNIQIRDITCDGARSAARMIGQHDAPFRDINLENVAIQSDEGLYCVLANGMNLVNVRINPRLGPVLSLKDTQKVTIHGLNAAKTHGVFLDLRGRQTRNIRLDGEASNGRPSIVLGIDVPKDAIINE